MNAAPSVLLAVLVWSASGQALTDVSVQISDGGPGAAITVSKTITNGEFDISIEGFPSGGIDFVRVDVVATVPNVKINSITCSVPALASDAFHLQVLEDPGASIDHVRSMVKGASSIGEFRVYMAFISGTIGDPGTTPGGSVQADVVSGIRAGTDINADINAPEGIGIMLADQAWRGDVFSGALIDQMGATGAVGSAANPIDVSAATYMFNFGYGNGAWANIDVDNLDTPPYGRLFAIHGIGDFDGTISAGRWEYSPCCSDGFMAGDFLGHSSIRDDYIDTFDFRADMKGVFDIGDDMDFAVLKYATLSGKVRIFGSYIESWMLIGNGSLNRQLHGQIIINGSNDGSGWFGGPTPIDGDIIVTQDAGGMFGSPIVIGVNEPFPGNAPWYSFLSSELGGGAIGLAPFNFHQRESAPPVGESKDCDPYQNETVQLGPLDDLNSVRIRHYGPVYVDGAGPHFRVEFKPRWLPSAWSDKTSLFEVDTGLTGTDELSATTDVYLKSTDANKNGFKTAGFWRIRPITGNVKCADVTANPDVEWDSSVVSGDLGSPTGSQYDWYAFDVLTFLALNSTAPVLDGDQVNTWDLAAWPVEPFDTNADGDTDAGDFVDMADAYDD